MTVRPSGRLKLVLRGRLTAVAVGCAFACGVIYEFGHIPALVSGAGLFVLFAFLWTVFIPAYARSVSVSIADGAACVRSGVIVRHTRVLPESRCVYCECVSGPLLRLAGLCSVRMRLARGVLRVEGMTPADAQLLMARMREGIR